LWFRLILKHFKASTFSVSLAALFRCPSSRL
jgi:hypothetical protein